MALLKELKSILWEYDISKLDLESSIVVERILNLWDKNITDLWFQKLWKQKARKLFLENSSKLDKKSYNYWAIIFWIKNKEISPKKSMYDKLNTPIFSRSFG